MKIIINLFFLIVLLHIFFAGCSETSEDELDNAVVTTDKAVAIADNISTTTALIIEEVRLKRDMRIMYKTLFIFFLHQ